MALEGTHIRFALDVKNIYGIEDLGEYLSGTVYPDSRYVTKIERSLTHDKRFLEKEFATDDFKKGWQSHLYYDSIQFKLISAIVNPEGKVISQNNDLWISFSAVKMLQEISDLEKFEIKKYLDYIDIQNNPNGEDFSKLKIYYDVLKDLYGKKQSDIDLSDYSILWRPFGIPKEVGNAMILRAKEFQNDPEKMKYISDLYDKSLKIFKETYPIHSPRP